MKILAFESSCDDTAVAIFNSADRKLYNKGTDGKTLTTGIISERVNSQNAIHIDYDGVVPELASREHIRNLPILLNEVLSESEYNLEDFDFFAVTNGPGLKGCLISGTQFVSGLSATLNKPLIGINHIEGHLLAPMISNTKLTPPYIAVLVSGGHTQVVLVEAIGKYKTILRTLDDSAGEAFDKAASMLGIPFPGGAELAKLADTVTSSPFILPRVMHKRKDLSFSGLKTAVAKLIESRATNNSSKCSNFVETRWGLITYQEQALIAYSVQEAIVNAIVIRVADVVKNLNIKEVALTGGVAANKLLRKRLSELPGVIFSVPKFEHCTDNAAMIAFAAYLRANCDDIVSKELTNASSISEPIRVFASLELL